MAEHRGGPAPREQAADGSSEQAPPRAEHSRARRGGARTPAGRTGPLSVKVIVTLSATSLLLTAAGTAAFTYQHFNSKINTFSNAGLNADRPNPAKPNAQGQTAMNILLLGSDARAGANKSLGGGDENIGHSDTTVLLHVYADRQHAVGISIPRDTIVDIPECLSNPDDPQSKKIAPNRNQFNWAFSEGGTAEGNAACTINTVEHISGIRVDHTVMVDFTAFAKLTEAIGGVQVCVPKDVNNAGGDNITLHKGIQTLSGKAALDYVREREGLGDGSDIGRTRRQQAFLGSMIKKIQSDGVLNDATKVSGLINAALQYATFDPGLGSLDALSAFADSLKGVKPGNVQFMTLPGHYSGARVEMDQNAAATIWDHLKKDQLLDGTDASGAATASAPSSSTASTAPVRPAAPSIPPSSISVRVLNGTTVTGLASDATAALSAQGYKAVISRADVPDAPVTTIVYAGSKQKAAAEQLATLFPGAKVEAAGRGTQLVLTLGADYAAAHPRVGGSSGSTSASAGTAYSSPGGASPSPVTPLPTAIAQNSRTADTDICAGITNGF